MRFPGRGDDERRTSTLAVLLATAFVAVATGLGGGDLTANPGALLRSIAAKSATLSDLLGRSNSTLTRIQRSLGPVEQLNGRMARLVDETGESGRRTRRIAVGLHRLDGGVGRQSTQLASIAAQLRTLDGQLGLAASETGRSLELTNGMSSSFAGMETSLGDIGLSFDALLRSMNLSVPQVSYFARNRVRGSLPGGASRRYKAPNVAAGTRVMSVMLPMIGALQNGGLLIARKDAATATSDFILELLNKQVPDGTNVRSTIHPFDGRYGLPSAGWFVSHPVGGF